MTEHKGEIIVGILGQWASGKSAAAKTLIGHLGGKDEAIFLTDRVLLASQAVNHILGLDASKVEFGIEDDGRQRIAGELATVYPSPGEELETVDLDALPFKLHEELFDNVPVGACNWLDNARLELGSQINERVTEGKPIVIEAGFGTNTEPRGENPFCHTISDLFIRFEEAGIEPKRVKWIIVEASYEIRSERNSKRQVGVPVDEFNRFAADGGDLDPEDQMKWEQQGTTIKRVPNEHDDIERFRADIIATFEEMSINMSPTIDGE